MIHAIRFFCLIFFLFVSSDPIFGEDQTDVWSQTKIASPVFDEMLANQIVSIRRELIKNGLIQEDSFFYIVTKTDEKKTFGQITTYLNGLESSVYWDGLFFVVPEFLKVVSLINEDQKEAFVVMLTFESDRAQWESAAEKGGLNLYDSVSVPELEFAKDEAGRQIVNLNGSPYEYRIYERLVREGMNPVEAHTEASEAIKKLRQMNDIQALFFTKTFKNQPKNLDLS